MSLTPEEFERVSFLPADTELEEALILTCEEMKAERDAAQASLARVRALADKMLTENGQSWNSLSGRRVMRALDGSDQ